MGDYQGAKNEKVTENSFGISILAYLFLLRFGKDSTSVGKSWSICKLQRDLQITAITYKFQHDADLSSKKGVKAV